MLEHHQLVLVSHGAVAAVWVLSLVSSSCKLDMLTNLHGVVFSTIKFQQMPDPWTTYLVAALWL